MLTSRGLGRVLGDLASMGFDARWGVLGAADIGANHQRDRIWIVSRWKGNLPHAQHDRIRWWEQQQKSVKETHGEIANTNCNGLQIPTNKCELESQGINQLQIEQSRNTSEMANSTSIGQQGQGKYEQSIDSAQSGKRKAVEPIYGRSSDFWAVEPDVGRVVDGVADRVDRLKAIGNGQVPLCAATAWRILSEQK